MNHDNKEPQVPWYDPKHPTAVADKEIADRLAALKLDMVILELAEKIRKASRR